MIHFEHTAAARRAVMGTIGLTSLALLAEPQLSIGLDCEGRRMGRGGRRERRIARAVCCRAWVGEDGGSIAPVEHAIEDKGNCGGLGPYITTCPVSSVSKPWGSSWRAGLPIHGVCLECEPMLQTTQVAHVVRL